MTDLFAILDASRDATARSLRAEALAEKAAAAAQMQVEAFAFVRGLVALIADPKASVARFHELDDRLAKATAAEAKLAKANEVHVERIARETAEIEKQRVDLGKQRVALHIERSAWNANASLRAQQADDLARAQNDPQLRTDCTLTREHWRDGEHQQRNA